VLQEFKGTVIVLLAVVAMLGLMPLAASADFIFDLTNSNITGAPSGVTYARVDVHHIDATHAGITVIAHGGYLFQNNDSFSFHVNAGTLPVSITSVQTSTNGTAFAVYNNWDAQGPGNADGFGSFNTGIDLNSNNNDHIVGL